MCFIYYYTIIFFLSCLAILSYTCSEILNNKWYFCPVSGFKRNTFNVMPVSKVFALEFGGCSLSINAKKFLFDS